MTTRILHDGIEYRPFDHLYAVSKCGKVLHLKRFEEAKRNYRRDGYIEIGRQRLLHRMVATVWVERPEGARHVHHKNHDKRDNRASNLEWLAPKAHIDKHPEHGRAPMPESGRQKLRDYRLGRKTSEETKQKQREASLRLGIRPPAPIPGYKHSETALTRMRENSPNARGCEIDGVSYPSFNEAGRALGMKPHTLRKRCLSASFGTYRLLGDD